MVLIISFSYKVPATACFFASDHALALTVLLFFCCFADINEALEEEEPDDDDDEEEEVEEGALDEEAG